MVNQRDLAEGMRSLRLPDDIQGLVNTIIGAAMALAARAADSNSDSNSLGGRSEP